MMMINRGRAEAVVCLISFLLMLVGNAVSVVGCITKLSEIETVTQSAILENNLTDVLTFRLCAETVYQVDANTNETIRISRPNVHVVCGDTGDADDACTVSGPSTHQVHLDRFELPDDPSDVRYYFLENVIFRGIQFTGLTQVGDKDNSAQASVLGNMPGKIRFIDCHWSDNTAAYLVEMYRRYSAESGSIMATSPPWIDKVTSVPNRNGFKEDIIVPEEVISDVENGSGSRHHLRRRMQDVGEENLLRPISFEFSRCTFTNNKLSNGVMVNWQQQLTLSDCTFDGNDLLSNLKSNQFSSLIDNLGGLVLGNNCFTNNQFSLSVITNEFRLADGNYTDINIITDGTLYEDGNIRNSANHAQQEGCTGILSLTTGTLAAADWQDTIDYRCEDFSGTACVVEKKDTLSLLPTPSEAPKLEPTRPPFPIEPVPCITSFSEIRIQMAKAIIDENIDDVLFFSLCPNTVYDAAEPFGYIEIFRPNVHIFCGQDGSSSNNCTLKGPSALDVDEGLTGSHVYMGVLQFNPDFAYFLDNIIISGITFTGLDATGTAAEPGIYSVQALHPGVITFVDCHWVNNEAELLIVQANFWKVDEPLPDAPTIAPSDGVTSSPVGAAPTIAPVDGVTSSPVATPAPIDAVTPAPIESVATPSPSPGAGGSPLDCDAGTDWDGWETSFAIGGCEYFEGLADDEGPFVLNDDEIGKPHCDLFYANLGGYDDNVDITANEACIVCGACDACTDLPFEDATGLTCEGYRDDAAFDEYYAAPDYDPIESWCSIFGGQPVKEGEFVGMTPNEACCVCGGGSRDGRRKSRKMQEIIPISLADTTPSLSDASIPSLSRRLIYASARQRRLDDLRNLGYASQRRNLQLSSGRVDVNFQSCTFRNNTVLKAIVFVDSQEISFKECKFEDNDLVSAKDPALENYYSSIIDNFAGNVTLTNNCFIGNKVSTSVIVSEGIPFGTYGDFEVNDEVIATNNFASGNTRPPDEVEEGCDFILSITDGSIYTIDDGIEYDCTPATATRCFLDEITTASPTPSPTNQVTSNPTCSVFIAGNTTECLTSLVQITAEQEEALACGRTDDNFTFKLCADTLFDVDSSIENPIRILSSQVEIICGDNGQRSNNCTIRSSDFHININASDAANVDNTVLISGVTFTGLKTVPNEESYSVSAASGGSVTFRDCIWENNDSHLLVKTDLPSELTDALQLKFDRCTFSDNKLRTGVLRNIGQDVNISGCTFSRNDLSGLLANEEFTTLVESVGGRLEVASTCFWDNALTLAPISSDNAIYTSRNNFGSNNSRPVSSFGCASSLRVTRGSIAQWQSARYRCDSFDMVSCEAATRSIASFTSAASDNGRSFYRAVRYLLPTAGLIFLFIY